MDKMREITPDFDDARHQNMDIRDLQFLYTRTKTDSDTKSTVAFMKDIIKFGMSGVEGLNEWMGPYLRLRGWARHATQDMSRYDSALEKIYKRYWRHGSVNPFMELGMLIVGSAVIYHWQNKQETLTPASPVYNRPASESPTPARTKRRSMKPPTFTASRDEDDDDGMDSGLGSILGSMMGGGGGGGGGDMLGNLLPLLKMVT